MQHPDGRYYYKINGKVFNFAEEVPRHKGKEVSPNEEPFKTQYSEFPLKELRQKRNTLLADTDWRDLPSYAGPKQAEWRVYRQALRDITIGLDTVEKVTAATYPTEPS